MPHQHLRRSTHALTSNTNNFGFDKMLVKQHLKPFLQYNRKYNENNIPCSNLFC